MTELLFALSLGALKALILLVLASAVVGVLRRQSARLRAVVWTTALVGCVLVPLAAPFMPTLPLPVPFEIGVSDPGQGNAIDETRAPTVSSTATTHIAAITSTSGRSAVPESRKSRHWPMALACIWVAGAVFVFARYGFGLLKTAGTIGRARSIEDPRWLALADHAAGRIGLKRPFRLLVSDEIEMPATAGFTRPVVLVPEHAEQWLVERREAVLLHELIHVARFDWPMRIVARLVLALYWFNPLAWWAVRRLELEQELACDEEVLAVGTRASNYASHLLGIARGAVLNPAAAAIGLEMAKRSQLEERIMTMLSRSTHRKARLAVLLPAVLIVAAMVPALAAVYPTEAIPSTSGGELKQILSEMHAAEARVEPYLEKIEEIEIDIEPQLEMINEIDIKIDEEAIAEIELKMAPYLERISEISVEMEPLHEKIEVLSEQIARESLHLEDGTIEEVERQIREQFEAHLSEMQELQVELEPLLEQLEVVHESMEHLHIEMEQVHVDMAPHHEAIEELNRSLEPFHEQMEAIHVELEPFHEEMERLGERLERVVGADVEQVLRNHLGNVVGPMAPFEEAAMKIVNEANIHVRDDVLEVDASRSETQLVLNDLFAEHRVGTESNFEEAVADASRALSPLKIVVE